MHILQHLGAAVTPRDLFIASVLMGLACIAGVVHLVDRHLKRKHEVAIAEPAPPPEPSPLAQYYETLDDAAQLSGTAHLWAMLNVRTLVRANLLRGEWPEA